MDLHRSGGRKERRRRIHSKLKETVSPPEKENQETVSPPDLLEDGHKNIDNKSNQQTVSPPEKENQETVSPPDLLEKGQNSADNKAGKETVSPPDLFAKSQFDVYNKAGEETVSPPQIKETWKNLKKTVSPPEKENQETVSPSLTKKSKPKETVSPPLLKTVSPPRKYKKRKMTDEEAELVLNIAIYVQKTETDKLITTYIRKKELAEKLEYEVKTIEKKLLRLIKRGFLRKQDWDNNGTKYSINLEVKNQAQRLMGKTVSPPLLETVSPPENDVSKTVRKLNLNTKNLPGKYKKLVTKDRQKWGFNIPFLTDLYIQGHLSPSKMVTIEETLRKIDIVKKYEISLGKSRVKSYLSFVKHLIEHNGHWEIPNWEKIEKIVRIAESDQTINAQEKKELIYKLMSQTGVTG